jgi:hypothetical protein
MNVSKYAVSVFAGVLGLLVNVPIASAESFTYGSYEVTNPQLISISQVYAGSPFSPELSGYMGQILLHGSGPNIGQSLTAWCLDPITYITLTGTYNVITPSPLTWPGGPNPPLTQDQRNQISSLMFNGNLVANGDPNASAAIQLAIWQVEYGVSFLFTTSSDITILAATYIANVDGGIWSSSEHVLHLLAVDGNDGNQALGFATPSDGPLPTPLPASIILFGSVLGAGYFGFRLKVGTKRA